MSRQPWMKFYPSDWRGSTSLKLVSMAARGLWIEMICIMHEADPYGHLVHKGRCIDARALASLVGSTMQDVEIWLSELEECGVVSRKKNGVLFSERMESDENRRRKASEFGKKGGRPTAEKEREKYDTLKGHDKGDENPHKNTEARVQTLDIDRINPVSSVSVHDLHRFQEAWNTMADANGLSSIRDLTDKRTRALKARLAEHGEDAVFEVISAVSKNRFLRGMEGNRSWKADFDFVIRKEKFQKIIEGGWPANIAPGANDELFDDRSRSVFEPRRGPAPREDRIRAMHEGAMAALDRHRGERGQRG